jgi:hypothetical protein
MTRFLLYARKCVDDEGQIEYSQSGLSEQNIRVYLLLAKRGNNRAVHYIPYRSTEVKTNIDSNRLKENLKKIIVVVVVALVVVMSVVAAAVAVVTTIW